MPHGGYHGTVTMGTDDKGDPKKFKQVIKTIKVSIKLKVA